MDCKTARLLLDLSRPHAPELDAGETEALDSHLADCPECSHQARQERRLDEQIGRALRAVPVPEALRGRLLRRLAADRDAWYGRWLLRAAGLAVAAALLLAVAWGALVGYQDRRPAADPQEFVEQSDRPTASPDAVESWFRANRGVKTTAPSANEFRYSLLTYYDLADLDGRRVPMLLFTASTPDGPARAQVYIVTDAQFKDLDEQANHTFKGSRGYKVKVVPNPDRAGVFYVVVYTDGAENRFFIKKRPVT